MGDMATLGFKILPFAAQHRISRVAFVSFTPSPNPTGPVESVAKKTFSVWKSISNNKVIDSFVH
jgi:hypothetical protein